MQDSMNWNLDKQDEAEGRDVEGWQVGAGTQSICRASSSQNPSLQLEDIIDNVNSKAKCMKWCVYMSVSVCVLRGKEEREKRAWGRQSGKEVLLNLIQMYCFPL